MARVLILLAHPALERSRVNRRLLESFRSIESVTVHDLYETYPDFGIDVPAEQELLTRNDVVVLQHPFYWYSCPSLMKDWIDLVFEHGWAYGQLLLPIEQTAYLCGMQYLAPFVVHGVFSADDETIERAAESFRAILDAICRDRFDFERAQSADALTTELVQS